VLEPTGNDEVEEVPTEDRCGLSPLPEHDTFSSRNSLRLFTAAGDAASHVSVQRREQSVVGHVTVLR